MVTTLVLRKGDRPHDVPPQPSPADRLREALHLQGRQIARLTADRDRLEGRLADLSLSLDLIQRRQREIDDLATVLAGALDEAHAQLQRALRVVHLAEQVAS